MKVLISGKNSYIGSHIKNFLEKKNHSVYELDTLGDNWKTFDYSTYDVVIHVAAIVHESAKNLTADIFKKINTDLPFKIAKLSKNTGVKQFVFMSSMAVYGQEKKLPSGNVINSDTPLNPITLYGKSKYEAEILLNTLKDDSFKVSIVRPPNVYGKGCKGNYMNIFKSIASKIPFFPYVYNDSRQSFLYIDNLSELVRLIIENRSDGVFTPQDNYIPNTNELLNCIRTTLCVNKKSSKFFGHIVKPFKFIPVINKLYGGVSYDMNISNHFNFQYQIVGFEEGINKTFGV